MEGTCELFSLLHRPFFNKREKTFLISHTFSPQLIFAQEYTQAEEGFWHLKHFCCLLCDSPLGGKNYVPHDGQPVCVPCFELKHANSCSTCKQVCVCACVHVCGCVCTRALVCAYNVYPASTNVRIDSMRPLTKQPLLLQTRLEYVKRLSLKTYNGHKRFFSLSLFAHKGVSDQVVRFHCCVFLVRHLLRSVFVLSSILLTRGERNYSSNFECTVKSTMKVISVCFSYLLLTVVYQPL